MKRAFTVVELVVVIGIMVVLLAVVVPAVKALTRGNAVAQSSNLAHAFIANARAKALSTGRSAGVVFFEVNGRGQMQGIVEDGNQARYAPTVMTVYVSNGGAESFPGGIRAGVLNDDPAKQFSTSVRVILFNGEGQMVMRNGLATPGTSAFAVWGLPAYTASDKSLDVSSPAIVLYNQNDLPSPAPANMPAWLKANADILVVNAYTGSIIR